MSTRSWLAALVLALLAFPALAQKAGTQALTVLDYTAPLPSAWVKEQPASSMRLGQYKVPGKKPGSDCELVVFYFGQGGGGPVQANVERWESQFTTADGKPVKAKQQKIASNGLPVTLVELNGSYARGVGMGPQGDMKPNQTLLVAIFETPQGNVTIQFHGPKDAIAANRKAFDAMVKGFRKGGA